jgi:hypothetical protein
MWSSAIPRRSVVKYSTPLGPVSCDLAMFPSPPCKCNSLSLQSESCSVLPHISHCSATTGCIHAPLAGQAPSPRSNTRLSRSSVPRPHRSMRLYHHDRIPRRRGLYLRNLRELALSKRKRTRLRPRPLRPRRLDCPSTASPESEAVNVIVGTFSTDEVTIDQYTEPESHMEPTPDGPRQAGQVRQEPA